MRGSVAPFLGSVARRSGMRAAFFLKVAGQRACVAASNGSDAVFIGSVDVRCRMRAAFYRTVAVLTGIRVRKRGNRIAPSGNACVRNGIVSRPRSGYVTGGAGLL
jgi:hypothetical protein